MKTKKAKPIYYKLMRISKTAHLLATMTLLRPESDYIKNIKSLVDELETAMICCKESESFYKSKDLLKD